MALLAAEITARTGKDPGEHYRALTAEFGTPYYTRIDAAGDARAEGRGLGAPHPRGRRGIGAGRRIDQGQADRAPGNGEPIGGLKVIARSGGSRRAVRHGEHLQDLRGELQGPGSPRRHRARSASDGKPVPRTVT